MNPEQMTDSRAVLHPAVLVTALITLILTAAVTKAGGQRQEQTPLIIYVGPQVRDGFIDVDQGILDSIKDIQGELSRDRTFRIVKAEPEADLVLVVVRRGSGSTSGAGVGYTIPGTGITSFLPVNVRVVETVLRVGTYEKAIIGEDRDSENWRKCAQLIVRDLKTWVAANRGRISGLTREP